MGAGIIFLAIIIGIVLYIIGLFNGLVAKRNASRNGFAQIDVQLHRRHDLIPNLVEATRAYMSHEKDTLERVIAARDSAVHAQRNLAASGNQSSDMIEKLALAEQHLSQTLAQFSVVMEQYPDLKADGVVRDLMEELSSTENRVGFARQAYNDQVMFYNNACELFPSNFIAGAFNFKPLKLLILDDPKAVRSSMRISI